MLRKKFLGVIIFTFTIIILSGFSQKVYSQNVYFGVGIHSGPFSFVYSNYPYYPYSAYYPGGYYYAPHYYFYRHHGHHYGWYQRYRHGYGHRHRRHY